MDEILEDKRKLRRATDEELFEKIEFYSEIMQDGLSSWTTRYRRPSTMTFTRTLCILAKEVRRRYPEGEPDELRIFVALKS
ncbi:MAG TPA: hypothetical protein VGI45_09175 [Terracidiphilus sp.]|jgi:hypothetical protein